jgi:hypothetical protein
MSLLNFSLGFISLCNLCFLVGAAFLLYRIIDPTDTARDGLNARCIALERQLDGIREQIEDQHLSRHPNQSHLIESQKSKIEALASREKELLERIENMDQAFRRNQTEKEFIEACFLLHDNYVAL